MSTIRGIVQLPLRPWQIVWAVAAVILLVIAVASAQDELPTREQLIREWAVALRRTVERSGIDWSRFAESEGHRAAIRRRQQQDTRPEEPRAFVHLSDEEVIAAIHERYRAYLGDPAGNARTVWLQHSQTLDVRPIPVSLAVADEVIASIRRTDAEHDLALNTLRRDQQNLLASAVIWRCVLPMAIWYGIGLSAPFLTTFARRRQSGIGIALLVLGAGVLAAGAMESDGFFGAVGAMMLVGGYLLSRRDGRGFLT